jgi:hypothetical protein
MKDVQQPSLRFKPLKEDSDYLIYEDGRLFNKKANRFLAGKIDNVGYRVYGLSLEKKTQGKKLQKMAYAHRLVAEYFIPNPNNLPYVNHIDENKLNNNVGNLEWVTPKENTQKHLQKNPKKERRPSRYHINDLDGEEWLELNFNALYSVSNMGRVKNNKTNKVLHLDNCQTYERVSLRSKGKRNKHYYVHRLVYCTFNNDDDLEGYVIDHIDGNPKNNKLSNLQKITQSENCKRQKRFNS